MKILVTGGRGIIGINLITELVSLGHDVISIDRKYKPNTSIDGVTYITQDINNIMELDLKNIDFIYHLAVVGVDKVSSFKNPNYVFNNIVNATNKVIEFSIKNNCKLIYAGSSSKFFNVNQSPYTLYKSFAEDSIRLYQKYFNLRTDITTIYNVYGRCVKTKKEISGLLRAWNSILQTNNTIDIYGDGKQVKDFIHINDVVSGLILLLDNNESIENWHIGSGESYSINDIFNFYKLNYPNIKYNKIKTDKCDNSNHSLLNTNFIKEYNWNPQYNLKKYIANYDIIY